MLCETIPMREDDASVVLQSYILDPDSRLAIPPRPAIVIFPGGGYTHLSPREAEPVAMEFAAAGVQSFVLYYSIAEKATYPRSLQDASRAVAYVRANAQRYNIDPARIFVIGFSAGGHLAATLGTLYASPDAAFPGMNPGENRPDGMILCYAPTSVHAPYVARSFSRTLGEMSIQEMEAYSPDCLVNADTPPAYIWHTEEDTTVPVEHSMLMASAMARAGVPFELHVFPRGRHGLSLADARTAVGREDYIVPEVTQWVEEATAWMLRCFRA